MGYSSAIQRNELLIHAATQVDLKDVMSKEKSVSKDYYSMIPFVKHSQKEKIVEM